MERNKGIIFRMREFSVQLVNDLGLSSILKDSLYVLRIQE